MTTLVLLVAYIIYGYTALVTVYLAVYAVAGRLRQSKQASNVAVSRSYRRMAVLIPAYREDTVILEAAQANLRQQYPAENFDVIVIADTLKPTTIASLKKLPVQVIEVSFESSTKAKALTAALEQLPDTYEVAVILDADNHMAPDFLARVNTAFNQGWRVVQGHRTAKNTNTPVAILDAVSEEINNHIFRKGHRSLGLASALIGSGMAFEFSLLKQLMPEVKAVGGFDKELEMRILKQGISAEYLEDAYVYDEKVQSGAVFETQRTRWIAAQFRYLQLNLRPGLKAFWQGNLDYADKVFQTMLLPRLLLLGLLIVGFLLTLVIWGDFPLGWFVRVQLIVLLITFYISVPDRLKALVGINELMKLPGLFIRYIRSIANFRTARHRFLHTPHGTDSSTGV
ncbi:glycosyltransferase [Spirosoma taeanense]|uniref:Glycosyltransferase n=1 Tax=Spirosoma taeanense TaxID=2735870 RepID=A0A6M5Y353_9BACT|nr:glycosyltransferase family 2 protein [Spirosoma taeanense]QJW88155.1 glycosyltransferase [Spirosoma taeanense]